jgi:solute carrier family 25 uncoupling protein 27
VLLQVTYPLDIIKTRLQIQGELIKHDATINTKKLPHGMFGIAVNIVQNEGARKLWAGVTPAVYRHLGS